MSEELNEKVKDWSAGLSDETKRLMLAMKTLLDAIENNTGAEPSLGCFHLAVSNAKSALAVLAPQEKDIHFAQQQSRINYDVILRSYGWSMSPSGEVLGLTMGDMGYEETGIQLEEDALETWKMGCKAQAQKDKLTTLCREGSYNRSAPTGREGLD